MSWLKPECSVADVPIMDTQRLVFYLKTEVRVSIIMAFFISCRVVFIKLKYFKPTGPLPETFYLWDSLPLFALPHVRPPRLDNWSSVPGNTVRTRSICDSSR